jgi:mandelamide amidase
MTELHQLGAVAAARAIRRGEITAEALAGALLGRMKAHAELNCFVDTDPAAVLEAARVADLARASGATMGALHGVPLTFKDNINIAGLTTTGGTPALRHHRPTRNARVAQSLVAAGAIALGKNGMHELSFGITSNNATFGAPRNPYDPAMIAGGSSGGTAAAVAARLAPAGIGTDTGGSVRIPASLCGLAGFRPTTGRWPLSGIVPISHTRDTPGPLARHVEDLVVLDAVVTSDTAPLEAATPRGIRLGVPRRHFWESLDDAVRRQCEAALETLRHAGVTLIEVDIADVIAVDRLSSFVVTLFEIRPMLGQYLAEEGLALTYEDIVRACESPDVSALLLPTLDPAQAIGEAHYREALNTHRPHLLRLYREHFARDQVDAYVFPTCPLVARPIGHDVTVDFNGEQVGTFDAFMRNTGPGSNADLPGLTLPLGVDPSGLPIGLSLDAPAGHDRRLLAIGLALEAILGQGPAPARY